MMQQHGGGGGSYYYQQHQLQQQQRNLVEMDDEIIGIDPNENGLGGETLLQILQRHRTAASQEGAEPQKTEERGRAASVEQEGEHHKARRSTSRHPLGGASTATLLDATIDLPVAKASQLQKTQGDEFDDFFGTWKPQVLITANPQGLGHSAERKSTTTNDANPQGNEDDTPGPVIDRSLKLPANYRKSKKAQEKQCRQQQLQTEVIDSDSDDDVKIPANKKMRLEQPAEAPPAPKHAPKAQRHVDALDGFLDRFAPKCLAPPTSQSPQQSQQTTATGVSPTRGRKSKAKMQSILSLGMDGGPPPTFMSGGGQGATGEGRPSNVSSKGRPSVAASTSSNITSLFNALPSPQGRAGPRSILEGGMGAASPGKGRDEKPFTGPRMDELLSVPLPQGALSLQQPKVQHKPKTSGSSGFHSGSNRYSEATTRFGEHTHDEWCKKGRPGLYHLYIEEIFLRSGVVSARGTIKGVYQQGGGKSFPARLKVGDAVDLVVSHAMHNELGNLKQQTVVIGHSPALMHLPGVAPSAATLLAGLLVAVVSEEDGEVDPRTGVFQGLDGAEGPSHGGGAGVGFRYPSPARTGTTPPVSPSKRPNAHHPFGLPSQNVGSTTKGPNAREGAFAEGPGPEWLVPFSTLHLLSSLSIQDGVGGEEGDVV